MRENRKGRKMAMGYAGLADRSVHNGTGFPSVRRRHVSPWARHRLYIPPAGRHEKEVETVYGYETLLPDHDVFARINNEHDAAEVARRIIPDTTGSPAGDIAMTRHLCTAFLLYAAERMDSPTFPRLARITEFVAHGADSDTAKSMDRLFGKMEGETSVSSEYYDKTMHGTDVRVNRILSICTDCISALCRQDNAPSPGNGTQ